MFQPFINRVAVQNIDCDPDDCLYIYIRTVLYSTMSTVKGFVEGLEMNIRFTAHLFSHCIGLYSNQCN